TGPLLRNTAFPRSQLSSKFRAALRWQGPEMPLGWLFSPPPPELGGSLPCYGHDSQNIHGREVMRTGIFWMLAASIAGGLWGCHKAESPGKVQQDVAKASDSAAKEDAQAAEQLAKVDAAASKDVAEAQARADEKTTDAAGEAVITQAEGDHKVALAQCKSLSGQAQKDCKKQADEQLEAVKAKVKQLKQDAG